MISAQTRINSVDVAAHKQKRGLSGSVYDDNPLVRMRNAHYALLLCTAIEEGLIKTDKNIEF